MVARPFAGSTAHRISRVLSLLLGIGKKGITPLKTFLPFPNPKVWMRPALGSERQKIGEFGEIPSHAPPSFKYFRK
jgi:hypothetical protein